MSFVPPILWLTPVPPEFSAGGGHIRQAHLIRALSARAEVHLVCSRTVEDPIVRGCVASLTELGVLEIDGADQPKILRRMRDLVTATGSTPREVAAFAPVRRAMSKVLADRPISTVVVEFAGLAPLIALRSPGERWVLTLHNLGSVMARQESAVAPGRRQRWLYRRDAAVAARWERDIVRRFDQVVCVSEADRLVLDPGGECGVAVVPNGVGLAPVSNAAVPSEPVVVFTGALYTGPNRDGIRWFCREVWPSIRSELADAVLWIVGSRPGPDVMSLADCPGVEVLPDVAEVRPYVERARVAVVPLRVGSGTRLKALEAMSAGRPVVGTTIGLDGLGLVDGRHAVFADAPEQFADAVCRVLIDDASAASLAAEGRRFVEERYAWEPIGQLFAATVLGPDAEGS